MQINNQNSQTYFGIKVSQNFINAAHNHYNYNVMTNKKQNIYNFNSVVDKFNKFGFDNYTLDYSRKLEQGNWQHYLTAVRDDSKKNVVILKRNTLLRLINKFLTMNKYELNDKIRKPHQNL